MANPYFNNSEIFGDPNRKHGKQPRFGATATVPDTSAYHQYGYAGTATLERPSDELATSAAPVAVAAPALAEVAERKLTYDDVLIKTAGLLAILVTAAAATYALAPGLWPIGMVVGLIFGMVNAFRRNPSPALIILYTAFQGVFLGGVSHAFQEVGIDGVPVSGLVTQAVLATFVTVAATLTLYRTGKIRVSGRFYRWLMISLVSFLAFQLVNLFLVFTGVLAGAGARGGGLGVLVGLVAVGLAAATLIVDFESIRRGVEAGVPARYAWSAAFGLMVTLVWLYLEFVRLAALLNQRR